MGIISQLVTTAGAQTPIVISMAKFRRGVGLIYTVVGTTVAVASVEVSGDNPKFAITHWNLHDLMQAMATSGNGNLAYPVSAVRLNVASLSVGGSVNFAVVQVDG